MLPEIIGEINKTVARQIGRKSGKVEIDERAIKHITDDHAKELARLGMSPIGFVRYILQNFNEIREGNTKELFIIVRNGLSKVAIVRMNYERGIYRVETATVMRESFINKKELLWKK